MLNGKRKSKFIRAEQIDENGRLSLLCHYTNRTKEKDEESKEYLLNLSKEEKIIALPEENTIYINDTHTEIIGNKPYYIFENNTIQEKNPKLPEW